MATSWTAADIVALEAAIKRGTRSVSYQSGRVDYHSLEEMLLLLDRMRAEVAGGDGAGVNNVIYAGRIL